MPEAPLPSLLTLFLAQCSSLIVWVLIGAAIMSGLLEDWDLCRDSTPSDRCSIAQDVGLDGPRIVRDGTLQSTPVREPVRDDVIALEAGDRIPADARVMDVTASPRHAYWTVDGYGPLRHVNPSLGSHRYRVKIGNSW